MATSSSLNCVHDMALKHKWLREASLEFEETLTYLHREFGEPSVEKVYSDVEARIRLLQIFPNAGLHYKGLSYKGYKVRILHMKKSSIVYCHDNSTLFILAFWNNRSDDSAIADLLAEQ